MVKINDLGEIGVGGGDTVGERGRRRIIFKIMGSHTMPSHTPDNSGIKPHTHYQTHTHPNIHEQTQNLNL